MKPTIHNQSGIDFNFTRGTFSCACINASVNRLRIGDYEGILFTYDLQTTFRCRRKVTATELLQGYFRHWVTSGRANQARCFTRIYGKI